MYSAPALGATLSQETLNGGVNFALYSSSAKLVSVSVYDSATFKIKAVVSLKKRNGHIWCGFVPNAVEGDFYAYLVSPESDVDLGEFFNQRKALLDPYAKSLAVTNGLCGLPELVGKICGTEFDWEATRKPSVPWKDTIIYEAHVKGLTQQCEQVPKQNRGKYLGVCDPYIISHLKALGITTLELMPCQAMLNERWLAAKGLVNYWGYNPVSFFAPTARYAIEDSVQEFKTMIKTLHASGIEVIVDLVFNHTAEGNLDGSTISLKGIDPSAYYLIDESVDELFVNFTGCGNTLDASHPQVVQMWMDALRVWYNELGVDGFRFDLGVTMGRYIDRFDHQHPFFIALQQDPDLKYAKIIFEPWDLGPHGYQLGRFPAFSAEWNGHFRDVVRSYIRGDGGALQQFSTQFVASFDSHFQEKDRASSSINFITAHDGFTLNDLVSYQEKHNELNEEKNRDGCHENTSRNYGVEGETQELEINKMRLKQKKNLMVALGLAKGIPMLLMGDEIGRTQQGNNNAYCQDNSISWLNWETDPAKDLRQFWQMVVELRQQFTWIFDDSTDIFWCRPDAGLMASADWDKWYARSVACCFERTSGDRFILIFNMHDGEICYDLPKPVQPETSSTLAEPVYEFLFDTSKPEIHWPSVTVSNGGFIASPHSIAGFTVGKTQVN